MFVEVLSDALWEWHTLHTLTQCGHRVESHCSGRVYSEDLIMVEPPLWTPLGQLDYGRRLHFLDNFVHLYIFMLVGLEKERFHSNKVIIIVTTLNHEKCRILWVVFVQLCVAFV